MAELITSASDVFESTTSPDKGNSLKKRTAWEEALLSAGIEGQVRI